MARPPEKSDREDTLPPAELNPLSNPILAQNMGRWAEVYFTTPPEHREAAVQALIEELRAEQTETDEPVMGQPELDPSTSAALSSSEPLNGTQWSGEVREASSVCHSCGEKNPEGQRFCGMCGAPLENFFTEADTHRSDTAAGEWETFHSTPPDNRQPESFPIESAQHVEIVREETMPIFSAYAPLHTTDSEEIPQWSPQSESWQGGADGFQTLSAEYGSVPYRYRIYIGVTLAALMGVLGYMGWRATHAFPRGHMLPAAPTVAQSAPERSAQPQSALPAAPTSPSAPSEQPIPNTGTRAESSRARSQTPPQTRAKSNSGNVASVAASRQSADRSSDQGILRRAASSQPAPSGTAASPGNGSQELALAETFLNGGNGHARDTSEAAKWLWQAVSKQNAPATLMLADLYLRGDGVPKNCDQGRLLLDAAARKGVAGAGERLRNLAAFGCK